MFGSQKRYMYAEKLISLRATGEENYFHFYNEVLAKLPFLEKLEVPVFELPILVSGKLHSKAFFRDVFSVHTFLKQFNWVVQEDKSFTVSKVIFYKPLTHWIDLLHWITKPVHNHYYRPAIESAIFIVRSPKHLRFIENQEELNMVCEKHGVRA